MIHPAVRPFAMALLAALLASCSSTKKIDYCPGTASILDTAIMTQFRPGTAPDAANALYSVQIVNVKGDCTFDKQGKTSDSSVHVSFKATRPSPGDAAQYTVPYFVAVTQANRIVTKQLRSVTFAFQPGATTADFAEDIGSVALVTDGDKKPFDYQVLVGLELTKAQLEYNRSIGIFAQ